MLQAFIIAGSISLVMTGIMAISLYIMNFKPTVYGPNELPKNL